MGKNGRKKARLNNCQPDITVDISCLVLSNITLMDRVHPRFGVAFFDRLPIRTLCSRLMSALSRPVATQQRPIEFYGISEAHKKSLQTCKFEGILYCLFRHENRPVKLAFFLFGGQRLTF